MEDQNSEDQPTEVIPSDKFVRAPRIMFRIVGVKMSKLQFAKKNFETGALHFISVLTISTAAVFELIHIILGELNKTANFLENAFLSICIMYITLGMIVWYKLQTEQKELTALVNKFAECFPMTLEQQHYYRVKHWTQQTNTKMAFFAFLQLITICTFNIFKFSDTFVALYKERRWQIDLVYPMWYPVVDVYDRGIFELCFLHGVATSIFVIVTIMTFDLLLCGWVEQLCMHADRLTKDFTSLNSPKVSKKTEQELMKRYIDKHNLMHE